ncbi:O-antigen polymerase [Microbulbifer sp. 2304DJ12-6]|uniref:O-antigen polymerase n=1 Tax=Microbulbifer sp. 2304DJ12-6 TaxID=3233340 RepID=UPI0039AF7AC5
MMQSRFLFFCVFLVLAGSIFSLIAYLSESPLMVFLSCFLCLLIVASGLFIRGNDIFSPLTWFSITYFGYVVGGVYYSFGEANYGKFLILTETPLEVVSGYMVVSLLWAITCYFMFCFGYGIFSVRSSFSAKIGAADLFMRPEFSRVAHCLIPVLLIIGFFYWVYVAYEAAGGILGLVVKFQAFRHLIADKNISTLPYHLYYAGIFLWLLVLVKDSGKIGFLFILLSFVGLVINLTQGRIMLSITFVLAQMFFVGLAMGDRAKGVKLVFNICLLGSVAVFVYFLRILSNYYFIGSDAAVISGGVDFFRDFFDKMVGSGNVADLQQLLIIFRTWSWDEPLFGVTYFDWIGNSFGHLVGVEPSSIGLTIKEIYFPVSSGAPTPGAIGEAFVNFSVLGPFFMMFVGAFFALLYRSVKRSGSYLLLMIYSIFLARFVLLYPKVDSTMMSNFFWGVAPFLMIVFGIYILLLGARRLAKNPVTTSAVF